MRILHLIPSLKKGGAERICINICSELQAIGNNVVIVILENANEYTELTKELNIKYINASYQPSILKNSQLNITGLQDFVNEFKPDVIHSHLYEADLIAFQIKNNFPVKFYSHIHSNRKELYRKNHGKTIKEKLSFYWERKLYLKLLNKKKVFLISISKDSYYFALNELEIKKSQVTFLSNCINFKKFEGETKTIENRTQLKFINIGRFVEKKAQNFLIDVCAILKKKKLNFELTFLGEGEEIKKVKEIVIKKNVSEHINFQGIVHYPEDFLSNSDIYLHSATEEPFGLVLIEAMASGLPVITTDGYGNRDLIIEGENGFMIWERNPEVFANKVIQLSDSPELYQRMSENAIKFASKFDIKPYCKKLIEIYQK